MNIQHCTLTGVDEKTDLSAIWRLSRLYSYAEFGILFTSDRTKGNRYPSRAFIQEVIDFKKKQNIPMSIHFCSESVYHLLEGNESLLEMAKEFDRLQLNFQYSKRPFPKKQIFDLFQSYPNPIVTQHNELNEEVTNFVHHPRHQVLIDGSLGRGKEIDSFQYLPRKQICGYAGGISSLNVSRILRSIVPIARGRAFWIDMETGLRDVNNWFCTEECEDVLDLVEWERSQ